MNTPRTPSEPFAGNHAVFVQPDGTVFDPLSDRTPTTAAGRALRGWMASRGLAGTALFWDAMLDDIIAIEAEARAPLDVDDLESIALALQAFPTWFDRTADKVEAMRFALTGQPPRLVEVYKVIPDGWKHYEREDIARQRRLATNDQVDAEGWQPDVVLPDICIGCSDLAGNVVRHRDGAHVFVREAAPLDVERLAHALHMLHVPGWFNGHRSSDLDLAADIAREYAALEEPTE